MGHRQAHSNCGPATFFLSDRVHCTPNCIGLNNKGWISVEWKDSDLGRPGKFYTLTREGKKQLERELKSWERLSSAVQLVIENA